LQNVPNDGAAGTYYGTVATGPYLNYGTSGVPTLFSTPTNQAVAAANAASAHNNIQPYEVAAMWRRTA